MDLEQAFDSPGSEISEHFTEGWVWNGEPTKLHATPNMPPFGPGMCNSFDR
jgi:hypothetical protein